MEKQKYNLIIFDLDGTLMDTSTGISKSIDYTVKFLNLRPMTEKEKQSCIGPPIQKSLKQIYNLSDEETKTAANIFREAYKDQFLFYAETYNQIEDLILQLKSMGIKCAVATYKREDYTMKLLKKFHLFELFDFVKGSDMEGKLSKTDIIKLCIDYFKESNDNCVMIGDTTSDYNGAKELGIDFLPVLYGFGFKNQEDLQEISKIGVAKQPIDILQLL